MTKFNPKRLIMPVVFLIFACAVALFMILSMYTRAYAVSVDGDTLCYVSDADAVNSAIKNVETRVGEILDYEYTLDRDIVCEEVFVQKEKVDDTTDKLENELYNSVPDIMDSYALIVDGELVGAGDDEDELSQIIRDVRDQYINENTVEATILSDVDITYETIPSETESDKYTISDILTSVTDGEITYEVKEGETVSDVADNADVTVNQIVALNPELTDIIETASNDTDSEKNPEETVENGANETTADTINYADENVSEENTEDQDETSENDESGNTSDNASEEYTELADIASDVSLNDGMKLTVKPETILLTVQTIDLEKHSEEVQFETEEIEDDTIPSGETEIIQEGQNGTILVSEFVTKLNGTETGRVLDDVATVEEPVPEIISVGTKGADTSMLSDDRSTDDSAAYSDNITADGKNNTNTDSSVSDNENTNTAISNNNNISTGTDTNNTTSGTTDQTTGSTTNGTTDTYTTEQNDTTDGITYDYADTTESTYAGELRAQIVDYAMQFIGCPYVHAGHGPNVFDCSGFTGFLYNQFGYNIPYTVEGQLTYGISIPHDLSVMEPGDLIFFATTGTGYATHVGMYVGNGQYIHASSTYGQVMLDTVRSPSYRPIVGIRRLIY